MPYASNKQAAFMHIHHPDIAAKWHEEGHGYVKGGKNDPNRKKRRRVSKAKAPGWLQPLAIGTAGGALANQLPSFEEQKRLRENRRRRKEAAKSAIKKVRYEDHVASDDPEFNHVAARKAFDLVMKMDADTAEMFCTTVIGQIFETDVEKNQHTLQRHLDEVIAKRIALLKSAVMRSVSKGNTEGAKTYAQALADLERVCKADDDNIPNWAFERKIRRGRTGRFEVKAKHTQTKPFSDRTADSMGLRPTTPAQRGQYTRLSNAEKAQYQDEYNQISNFLNVVSQSSGDAAQNIALRMEDKRGNEFLVPHPGGGADVHNSYLLNPNYRLLAMEAAPAELTAGGAGFGLANAMGMGVGDETANRMAMAAAGGENFPTFQQSWMGQPTDMKGTNDRLYNRTAAAGAYVGAIAPPTSKVGQAAKLAQVVGSHGPEAEAVIGPAARKTAYRYRGTEKKPDSHLVTLYNREVQAAKLNNESAGGSLVDETEMKIRRAQRPGLTLEEAGAAGVSPTNRKATAIHGVGSTGGLPGPATMQMGAARARAAGRAPTWGERANGRRVLAEQLKLSNVPSADLYNLQAESGNLPPSEGVMLNKDGQIVTQAIGYGDDHYLPFNLKNLKQLKGGEYIRTRSVGGLTSEDIYTGLMAGARRVTVVSRSGTFSVEFEPDFRGGRRYNDKALRMTRRYENLLDAVQSNQVSRGPVPPQVNQAIATEVARDFPGETSRAVLRKETERRIKEYRQDPEWGPEDQKIMNLVYEQGLKDNPSRDEVEWTRTARNMVMQGKRYNYQLDATGYEAAQNALAEQFPYYIKSQPVIEKEGETVSTEKDKGYVEPGRNRPTAVRAGLFGTEANAAEGQAVGQQKFSASQADYQRGRLGPGRGDIHPRLTRPAPPMAQRPAANEPEPEAAPGTPAAARPGAAGARADLAQRRADLNAQDGAIGLFDVVRDRPELNADFRADFDDVFRNSSGEFRTWIQDPNNRERFHEAVEIMRPDLINHRSQAVRNAMSDYDRTRGAARSVGYEPGMELTWGATPMNFPGERGYGPEATDEERLDAIRHLDSRNTDVITGLPLSQLDDRQSQDYLNALGGIRREIQLDPTIQDENTPDAAIRRRDAGRAAMARLGIEPNSQVMNLITRGTDENLRQRMVDVHRMRNIRSNMGANFPGTRVVNPGSPVPQGQQPAQVNPVADVVNHLGLAAQVKNRSAALQRAYGDDVDNTTGAQAMAEAMALEEDIDNGLQVSPEDVAGMLESTKPAFRNVPHRFDDLDVGERRLAEVNRELFDQDQHGLLHRRPVT